MLFWLLVLVNSGAGKSLQPDDMDNYRQVSDFVDDNEACFKCHGESKFQLADETTGRILTRNVCRDQIILREKYYLGNHKSFPCSDCHSKEFAIFPHPLDIRLEEPWACMDCHGYDEDYAHYQFEKIEEEYLASTHHLAAEEFSCWKCHNPHSYKISIRNTENLTETIAYDNAICLSCHADFDQFQLLTDRDGINIIQTHDWLPNQALHFQNVRCIECHTQVNDSILVAHLVLPKEEAVQNCNECHSSDSRLMHTLYKHQSLEAREKYGFLNAVVINEAYVIGANRNYILNRISMIIFGLVVLGLALHGVKRIVNKV
jgi:predicted CXXCH cytochrome family protein